VIGTRHDGTPVLADIDGYIVFPNPNAQPGQEWFYLARHSTRCNFNALLLLIRSV